MIRFIELFSGIGGFRFGLKKTNKSFGKYRSNKQTRSVQCSRSRRNRPYSVGKSRQNHFNCVWANDSQQDNGTQPHLQRGGKENIRSSQDLRKRRNHPNIEAPNSFRCVWSNEIDKYACQIYRKNFGDKELYEGDIRTVNPDTIPDFDLLTAGFPCQAFSVAGKRKGFSDTRGTLFYEICRIAKAKKPVLLLLENVKGLLSHDEGLTFQVILESLEELGYWCEWQVFNSKHHGVPQNRERVFIIGHLTGAGTGEIFPITETYKHIISSRKETQGEGSRVRVANPLGVGGSFKERNLIANTLSKRYYKDGSENLLQIGILGKNNQANRIYSPDGLSPTIPTSGGGRHEPKIIVEMEGKKYKRKKINGKVQGGDSSSISSRTYSKNGISPGLMTQERVIPKIVQPCLTPDRLKKRQQGRRFKEEGEPMFTLTNQDIHGVMTIANTVTPDAYLTRGERKRVDGKAVLTSMHERRIRRLTPIECERLQGFPDNWTEGVSDTQRYKCLGNAVTVNVIKFLGEKIMESLTPHCQ